MTVIEEIKFSNFIHFTGENIIKLYKDNIVCGANQSGKTLFLKIIKSILELVTNKVNNLDNLKLYIDKYPASFELNLKCDKETFDFILIKYLKKKFLNNNGNNVEFTNIFMNLYSSCDDETKSILINYDDKINICDKDEIKNNDNRIKICTLFFCNLYRKYKNIIIKYKIYETHPPIININFITNGNNKEIVTDNNNKEITIDNKEIVTDNNNKEITIDNKEIVTDNNNKEITIDNKEITIDNKEITIDNKEITIDNKEITIDNKEITIDNKEITIDNKEITIDNKEITIDNKEITIDNKEITIDNKEITIDNKEITIDNKEITIDNKEITIDNKEITIDKEITINDLIKDISKKDNKNIQKKKMKIKIK